MLGGFVGDLRLLQKQIRNQSNRLRQTMILISHIVDSANGATMNEHTHGCLASRLRRGTLLDNLKRVAPINPLVATGMDAYSGIALKSFVREGE